MTKYREIIDGLFITNLDIRSNGVNGNDYWEIQFKTIASQEDYYTYADPSLNNWRYWEQIIEAAHTKGVVVSNVKVKDEKKRLLNADAEKMTIVWVGPKPQLAETLAEFWDNQSKFNQLFGT